MVERGEHLGFALKTGQPVVVGRQRRWQDLERDLTFQVRVGRPIHLAHAAFAEEGDDFVDAETGAGGEGHTVVDYMSLAASPTRLFPLTTS